MRLRTLILAAASLAAAYAQTKPAETPAARQFLRWLEVFNNGDRAALEQFFKESMPAGRRVENAIEFREMTGGFEFKKFEETSAARATGIVKERDSNRYARFTVEVEPEPPHRIKDMNMRVTARPPEYPPAPRLSEKEALDALRAEVERRASQDRFSGAVLVARNGKRLFAQAYGLADREKKIPNRLDTRFRIGSMNKMFTAVAIAQLAQAGKLAFQDPLVKHLPDYPNRELASKVTVHHLLTHTGGTGDIFGPQFDEQRLKLRELKDYVALYGERKLGFEPGARWAYSNYGFLLLGYLIEKVTGKSYYDYVRENIYKPAGMSRSDSLAEDEQVDGRSVGYMREGGKLRPNNDTLPYRGTSAGGGYSTVEDLARFASALLGHKLLNAEYTKSVTTGKVDAGGGRYAYGFSDSNADGIRSFGHGGGAPGMNGDLRIFPDSGYVIAVLANLDPPAAGRISEFISDRLPAK